LEDDELIAQLSKAKEMTELRISCINFAADSLPESWCVALCQKRTTKVVSQTM